MRGQFKSLLSMIILLCVIHGVNGVQKQPSPKPNQQDSSELTDDISDVEHLLNDLNDR